MLMRGNLIKRRPSCHRAQAHLALHLLLCSVGILGSGALCPSSPSPTHSQCRICFCAWLGSLVLPRPLLRTPGAAFAFALSWDLGGDPIPSPSLSTMFAQSGSLVVVPWACSPSPTHSQRCCACSPSLAHSWHCVCSVGMLGGGAVCLLALSHALLALLCLLTLSRALLAPRLLGWDAWWWCHVPACPLPCTPGAAVPAHPLSRTPGTAFA
jgi:hypothetical protein